MSTLLEDRIEEIGLKQIWIADKLGITTRTLQYWLKYENLSTVITFIRLLEILNLPLIEVAEDMKKNKVL